MAALTLAGMSRVLALVALVALVVAPACALISPETGDSLAACVDGDSNPAVNVSFAKDIRPIIDGRVPGPKPCADCHYLTRGSQDGVNESGLRLATLEALRRGGTRTFDDIIVPGSPCRSAIIQKIRGTFAGGARMPKGGPYWTPEQTQLFMDWISEGALGENAE